MIIFADFSRFNTQQSAGLKSARDLFNNLVFLKACGHRIVVSVSTGVQHSVRNEYGIHLNKFLGEFNIVNFTIGFTDDEASQFVAKRNCNLMFEQVKYTSGNNPHLLSLLPNNNDTTVADYKSLVKGNVMHLLQQHIQGVVKNVSMIEEYFKRDANQRSYYCVFA